jgi:hypothetical protein
MSSYLVEELAKEAPAQQTLHHPSRLQINLRTCATPLHWDLTYFLS